MGIWSDCTFWQWTWTGNIGGINPVDRNAFAGEMVDLADYIVGFVHGDYNDDGQVDAADYSTWRDTMGKAVLPGRGADGNLNGIIDAGDYDIWKSKFAASGAGGGAISVVPEPASIVFVLMAAAATLLSRRRGRVVSAG
jgi:hypothetical protein